MIFQWDWHQIANQTSKDFIFSATMAQLASTDVYFKVTQVNYYFYDKAIVCALSYTMNRILKLGS